MAKIQCAKPSATSAQCPTLVENSTISLANAATPYAGLRKLEQAVCSCRKCPELRSYCKDVAIAKRRAFSDWDYWGRPVPGFGDPNARVVIVGLAPAAHGANRTGRMFTGDRSGEFLYQGLYRAGFANQPASEHRDDGLRLSNVYIAAAARCAPPANRPTPAQLARCRPYLVQELELLRPAVVLCLGAIAWSAALAALGDMGVHLPRPRPKFAHGAEIPVDQAISLLACYHVSQQNTFTGRLTPKMLDAVLARAAELARKGPIVNR